MRVFKIITITIIAITIVFAGCKRGNDTTKPEVEPTTKPTTTNITQATKPSTDLGMLTDHFATKKYAGDTKQYTIDDIIAPKKIISALTNTKISYIKLLRNEILARRGYVFKPEKQKQHGLEPEVIKEILRPAKWYSGNPDFIYADLNKIEIANISFLKRLEKIEAKRGNFARQLALVVGKNKHEINTDEAMMIFKITKDADVLTSLNPTADKLLKELIKYDGWNAGNGVYRLQFGPDKDDDIYEYTRKYGMIYPGFLFSYSKANTASKKKELYTYAKFILSLKEGDRIYLKGHNVDTKKPMYYVGEVYMNFPITEDGKGKSVLDWNPEFNWDNYLPLQNLYYNRISSYKDRKILLGSAKKIKVIDTKTKTIEDIIPSPDFQKVIDKYVIKQIEKGLENLPYDLCLYQESVIDMLNIARFDNLEFYFWSAYRSDVRNPVAEARPYKAEWTNDNSLFRGVRLYRYIKVR